MDKEPTGDRRVLEELVADAYRQMGARKVEQRAVVAGNHVPIYVEFDTQDHGLHRIAVDTRDWRRRVGINTVKDFAAKLNLLRGGGYIDDGVIVSANGFSRQARSAAQTHGLILLQPSDLEAMVNEASSTPPTRRDVTPIASTDVENLERLVAQVYRQMGAHTVEHDKEIAGYQIDVYVELQTPGRFVHRVAVEVKDWSNQLGIEVVNQFAEVLRLLRRERLVDEGVIVSKNGFTPRGREAAQEHSVRLLEIADLLPEREPDAGTPAAKRASVPSGRGITRGPGRKISTPKVTSREPSERIEVAIRALSDRPIERAVDDLLGFSDYAEALAYFIRNKNTEKPLTIGIDAPWGMGKTSMMNLIKEQLLRAKQLPPRDQRKWWLPWVLLRILWMALRSRWRKWTQRQRFPYVWFDAWRYTQEESLLAALALKILKEIPSQSTVWQRFRLWAKLLHRRLALGVLVRSLLESTAYILGVVLLGATVYFIGKPLLGTVEKAVVKLWTENPGAFLGGAGIITILVTLVRDLLANLTRPLESRIDRYLRRPDYEDRLGFLAEFQADFRQVIDVVTESGKWPLVIFIDDLDRCAPPRPAEIMEAINILLDAKHCVFVIGMDAQAVAGSIEAKYSDLLEYLDEHGDDEGLTLGQRFLQKMIQISFHIPSPEQSVVKDFINKSLHRLREDLAGVVEELTLILAEQGEAKSLDEAAQELRASRPVIPEPVVAHAMDTVRSRARQSPERAFVEQLIEAEERAGKTLDQATRTVQASWPDIPSEFVAKAKDEVSARSFDDSEEVRSAIHEAALHLKRNPRKVKRFINLFRLQVLIANSKGLLEKGSIRLGILAKAVVVAMRWPDVFRATMSDSRFIEDVVLANDARKKLRAGGMIGANRRSLEAHLEALTADHRVARLMDDADLIRFLDNMTQDEREALPRHLHLAQTTVEA